MLRILGFVQIMLTPLILLARHQEDTSITSIWLTLISCAICALFVVIQPHLHKKRMQELARERERKQSAERIQKTLAEYKKTDWVTDFSKNCVLYILPSQGTESNKFLLTIIHNQYVVCSEDRFTRAIIKHIEENMPSSIFTATPSFLLSHCQLLGFTGEESIFKKESLAPYKMSNTIYPIDYRIKYLPYLLELDSLSLDVEREYSNNPERIKIVGNYLVDLGISLAEDVCRNLPSIHNGRIASSVTKQFQDFIYDSAIKI